MAEIIFTKAALCYYLLGIFTQYHWIFGKLLTSETGTENLYSRFFYTESFLGAIFLIYYSYKTHWWAIIPLFILNMVTYTIVNFLTTKANEPGNTRARLANVGLVAGPLLLLSMFFLSYSL